MMKRLQFSIHIKAEKETIWNALWNEEMYRAWAAQFFKGSYAVTDDWKEGTVVHFLAPDKSGIYSRIYKHRPNETIQFIHQGLVKEGQEQAIDDDTKKWSGASETYSLIEEEEKESITLYVEIDVMAEHEEFMTTTFPKALEVIKANCI